VLELQELKKEKKYLIIILMIQKKNCLFLVNEFQYKEIKLELLDFLRPIMLQEIPVTELPIVKVLQH
jgi:hypothetical protein